MKILAHWTKLNKILYTYSVDPQKTCIHILCPQKARNAKTNHSKWGASKMTISKALFTQLTKRREIPTKKHFVKKQAKFEKVVKSTVQSSYIRQE